MKTCFLLLFTLSFFASSAHAKSPYKLGVVLVVDQFRADYFMRFRDQFVPSSMENPGGYRFFLNSGAYFPLADHGLLQNMTCPGHAAILSGAYPYRHGIGMNSWYDRENKRAEYCVRDYNAKLVGSHGVYPDASLGISPQHFNATTVGDELKNTDRASRVISVSLKDRAAVMLGGKRADQVVWLNDKACEWVSSQYYLKDQALPQWVKSENEHLSKIKSESYSWGPYQKTQYCSKDALQTPWAIEQTFNLALSAVKELKLGKGSDVDLLTISLSSHDYLGHRHGPNSVYLKDMTLAEDKLISAFLRKLAKEIPGGLKDVFFVVTGDHGVPPSPQSIPQEKIPNGNISEDQFSAQVEEALTRAFGKPKGGHWIEFIAEFQLYLNKEALRDAKVSVQKIGAVIRERFTGDHVKEKYIDQVWVRDDIMVDRKVPAGEVGIIGDRTLTNRSGDILFVLNPYFYSDSYPLTHMTHYSYDRYVPLVFWGKTFKPGVYKEIIRIIDLAPTLSSVLGVIPPAQSEGRVISEILR